MRSDFPEQRDRRSPPLEPGRAPRRPARRPPCFCQAVILLGLVNPLACDSVSAETLTQLRRQSSEGKYLSPPRDEIARYEALFRRALRGEGAEALRGPARELGFEVVPADGQEAGIVVLREMEGSRQGRGFYAFRSSGAVPTLLSAPHADNDAHTGTIVESLFLETRACAGAWSTVDRNQVDEGGRSGSDLTHIPDSVFHAMTRAFALEHPRGLVVQIHGFAAEERKSRIAATADMILSCGVRKPPSWLRQVASSLRAGSFANVLVFPDDVDELGALTNTQGKDLRKLGKADFLHMELGLSVRHRLKAEASARAELWKAISGKRP